MAWKSIADLLTDKPAPLALLGAPMEAGSVTPGRCDLAPETVRRTLRRLSTYDLETGDELDIALEDLGDVDVRGVSPADGFQTQEGSAQEQAVVGETPNLAARLQNLAEPGTIIIAASTRRMLGAQFRLRDLGFQQVAIR